MSLFRRLADDTDAKVSVHRLKAFLVLLQRGRIAQQLMEEHFQLTNRALSDFKKIAQNLAGLQDDGEKARYLQLVESVSILVEDGVLGEADFKAALNI